MRAMNMKNAGDMAQWRSLRADRRVRDCFACFCLGLVCLFAGIMLVPERLVAQEPAAQIELVPGAPNANDMISFNISGMWRDGCVPQSPVFFISGNTVQIQTSNPGLICTMAVTPWKLTGTFGKLAPGDYQLVVTHVSPGAPSGIEIGRKSFRVSEALLNERILPIIVNGSAGWAGLYYQTAFTLIGGGNAPLPATLQAYGNAAGIFCPGPNRTASGAEVNLASGGAFSLSTSVDLPFFNGWARVRWEGPDDLQASAQVALIAADPAPCTALSAHPSYEMLSSTQIPAIRPALDFRFPVTLGPSIQTALVLVNPSETETVDVAIRILGDGGENARLAIPSSFVVSLKPLQRVSGFLSQLAADSPSISALLPDQELFRGSLSASSTGLIAVGALNIFFPEGKFENVTVISPVR